MICDLFFNNHKKYFSKSISIKKLLTAPEQLINHSLVFSGSRTKEDIIRNCNIGYTSEKIIEVSSKKSIIMNPNECTDEKFTYAWDLLDITSGLRIEVKTYSTNINFINIGTKSRNVFPVLSPPLNYSFDNYCNLENTLLHKYADLILFVHYSNYNSNHIFTPTLLIEPIYSVIAEISKKTKYPKFNNYITKSNYLDLKELLKNKNNEYNKFFKVNLELL